MPLPNCSCGHSRSGCWRGLGLSPRSRSLNTQWREHLALVGIDCLCLSRKTCPCPFSIQLNQKSTLDSVTVSHSQHLRVKVNHRG